MKGKFNNKIVEKSNEAMKKRKMIQDDLEKLKKAEDNLEKIVLEVSAKVVSQSRNDIDKRPWLGGGGWLKD